MSGGGWAARRTVAAAVVLVGLLTGSAARAETARPGGADAPVRADPWRAPPVDRLTLNNVLAVRANPLGLEDQLRLVYQRRLYAHDSAVLRDNFLAVGLFPKFSPACLRVGPIVEVQPLSMLNLRATAEWAWFPRAFNYLQSFSSPTADYSDASLRARHDAGFDYSTTAFHATIEPTVQAKLGPFAIRNRLGLDYWDAKLSTGTRVFYEGVADTLLPNKGWLLSDDLDLLYVSGGPLIVGARYTLMQPLYRATDFAPGETAADAPNGQHRIGALLAYTFFDQGFTTFNKPTVFVNAAWYVQHRFRTTEGQRWIPYVLAGVSFTSDFLSDPGSPRRQ